MGGVFCHFIKYNYDENRGWIMGQLSNKLVVGVLAGTLVVTGFSSVADAASRYTKPATFNYVNFKKDWNGKLGTLEKQVVSDKWNVLNEFSRAMDGKVYYTDPDMVEAHEEFNRSMYKYRATMDAKIKKIDALQASLKKVDTTKERDAFLRSVKGVTYAKGQLHKDRVAMQDVVSKVEVALMANWYESERLFKVNHSDLYQNYGNFTLYSTDQKLENYELNKVKELGRAEMLKRLAKGNSEESVSSWYVKYIDGYENYREVGITQYQIKKYIPYERELYLRSFETLGDMSRKYALGLQASYAAIDKDVKNYLDKVVKR